ncbi:MAG: formate/nitrite transporter family protein [Chloroflexi bacterium]|nr:formate/nitrite transporter family protein [Chloroflexota bacterium]
MYQDTIDSLAQTASKKLAVLRQNPLGFFVGSMMAGAYVGFGIILIFILGTDAEPAWRKLIMGASFGIALTLVVFAGSELFTGHTMYMTLAWLRRKASLAQVVRTWSFVWIGNLVGATTLAAIFVLAGAAGMVKDPDSFLNTIVAVKMNESIVELLSRAILCNWLVTLALWMSARMTSDIGKANVIFWCLFAFITSGFEHSVANMTLFTISLLGEHPDAVNISGMLYNLFWVTLGNLLSGSLFVAGGYWLCSGYRKSCEETISDSVEEIEQDERALAAGQLDR